MIITDTACVVVVCECSIGLQHSEGIGLISYNQATLVTLGGCPLENRVYQYSIANTSASAICVNNPDTGVMEANLGPPSSAFSCPVSAGCLGPGQWGRFMPGPAGVTWGVTVADTAAGECMLVDGGDVIFVQSPLMEVLLE